MTATVDLPAGAAVQKDGYVYLRPAHTGAYTMKLRFTVDPDHLVDQGGQTDDDTDFLNVPVPEGR